MPDPPSKGRSGLPRPLELLLALAGLLATLPLVAVASVAVRLTSQGPAFFRQQRVGRGGRPFTLWKLRTMRTDAGGSSVTVHGDDRVTSVGRWLRRTKVDELPQLWNVVRGDLSLVGPRPEVPRWVDRSDARWREILSVRPGLTDPVTLRLRGEEELLAALLAELSERRIRGPDTDEADIGINTVINTDIDTDTVYRRHLQPWKLRGYVEYLRRRRAWTDLRCLLATFGAPMGLRFGVATEPPSVAEVLAYTDSDA